MSLIEGIGDEVTLCVTVLVLATTVVVAWFSTRVRDRPPPQVRVIQTTITARRGQPQQQQVHGNVSSVTRTTSGQSAGGEDMGNSVNDEAGGVSASVVGGEDTTSGTPDEATNTRTPDEADQTRQYNQIAEAGHLEDNLHDQESSSPRTEDIEHPDAESITNTNDTISEVNTDQKQSDRIVETHSETVEETDSGLAESEPPCTIIAPDSSGNVLRNRQTGQTYPTLPSFSSEAASSSQEAASSSETSFQDAGAEGNTSARGSSNGVEDLGNDEPRRAAEGTICIRVRFSNDETRLVHTNPGETLGQFRRQNFVEEIQAGKLVRFIANGQFLADDNQTLASLNLTNNSVLHCHLSQGTQASEPQQQAQDSDIDLGHFMVPLFGFILGFVWYFRLQYRYMFNATSTLSLVGVTVLFILAVLAAWRG